MSASVQFGHTRTPSMLQRSKECRPGRCVRRTALATTDPCSTSTKFVNPSAERAEAPSSAPAATRRQLLGGAALLSSVAALEGVAAGLAPRPAAAKVSISSLKKGGEGERDIEVTASGIRMSLLSSGRGEAPSSGSVVLVDVVGSLEDGTVFLDTRAEGAAPLAFQLGTTNKLVTEGLAQVVETMRGGDVKLAVVPPSLGYGSDGVKFKSGRRVPPNAPLYYEVSLLRCQTFSVGMACCSDADFPCIKKPEEDINFTSPP
ncbi:hypothetical protein PLESTB_000071500 [Pleodorina starrii]|uniref:peptidylprolyl isomerase n=1 Tax=Pleodorina starrii TaxID=330485 RepID=A0A9W6BAI2_9CHLO|nr:hypothetical protein PLESTM_000067100 [Pleodorina starrii]GLC48215.1 hypothetical protein PLESTB_000071500 [Pleodorina starrii]GLC66505.1 hypothetical protein PLESTF_000437800 [Pleodorina starrii]